MLIDASAIVAIILREPESDPLLDALDDAAAAITHPISVWEAACAVARATGVSLKEAHASVQAFLDEVPVRIVEIGVPEMRQAIEAASLYGRASGHPANLNLGDCFTYGVAKQRGLPLLYKGNDFVHTPLG
jgi:ribonuclease VapC